jgi:hypothetical protein
MSNFGTDLSKFKMVLYLKNGDRKCFYSLLNEEKKGDQIAIRGMQRRLLENRYKGKYQTAIIYDRIQDKEVQKFINGKMEKL